MFVKYLKYNLGELRFIFFDEKIYLYIIFKIKVYKKYKSSNQEKKKQI